MHTFGKEKKSLITSYNHRQASSTSQLQFWTSILLQSTPALSGWKGAFTQRQFWDLTTGIQSDLDPGPLLTTSELSSALSSTMDAFWSVFGVTVLLKHPWLFIQTSFLTLDPTFHLQIFWESSDFMMPCMQSTHTLPERDYYPPPPPPQILILDTVFFSL